MAVDSRAGIHPYPPWRIYGKNKILFKKADTWSNFSLDIYGLDYTRSFCSQTTICG